MAQDHKLAVDIGIRAAGSAGEQQAAEYIQGELQSYGYDAHEQAFPIQAYQGISTTLEVTGAGQSISANPLTFSASGDVTGEIVVVPGVGQPADFPAGTQGRIALIQRGTITFGQKVTNAEVAGAIGVIVYNSEPGALNATLGIASHVPAVAISLEDGQALVGQTQAGTVQVHLAVQASTTTEQSHNVVAEWPGGGDCQVIIGGHYDSVPAGPGANDNGSGTSVAIEMARVLAARGEDSGVCVVLFGSEELGLLGSQYYVSQLTEAQKTAIKGVLNFDMLAVGDQWPMVGSDSLTALAVQKAQALGVDAYAAAEPPNVGSDHASFINAGIPAILFNCFCDPNYHTAADRYEFLQADRLKTAGDIGLAMVEALMGGRAA